MRLLVVLCVVCCVYSQNAPTPFNLQNDFTQKIGNFSLELLYHTAGQEKGKNLIMSPITVWTLFSVIAEGASGNTLAQINYALRAATNNTETRIGYQNIAQWLPIHTITVDLAKLSAIFIDESKLPLKDFEYISKTYYDTEVVPFDPSKDAAFLANQINQGISQFTHGKIKELVDESFFSGGQMLLTSGLYFKGQWTAPFNASLTSVQPFYDSNGNKIGQVNMMHNSMNYPFANIHEIQARVIELSYGEENRLSMLVMLPHRNVTLQDMFKNFLKVPLDTVFSELKLAQDLYNDDKVDCFLPRFKIESNIVLTDIMKDKFGIVDLFDVYEAWLPKLARTPLYVTKAYHKAEIEVTEEGTVATGLSAAELADRIGAYRFEANRPFSYVIVEKVTNTIVFGGFYEYPSLF